MRYRSARGFLVLALVAAFCAAAQTIEERLRTASSQAKDLEFPAETSRLNFFSRPHMAIYKPESAGPFPALVLFHQCGGLSNGRWTNDAMLAWAKEAVARGYVAFIVDAFSQRNVDTTCYGAKNGVNFARTVKDALQAAEHLRRFDFVDRKRIALAGYSYGAMVGVLASSKLWGAALAPGERFNAAVSFYPGCFTIRPPGGRPYEIVNADIDRPLLVLMGEKDNETPPQDCVSRLEPIKAAGAPVEWHVYPGTTHCWDCENLHGFSKVDVRNNQVVYYYDRGVTRDSAQRMFEFLQRSLAR